MFEMTTKQFRYTLGNSLELPIFTANSEKEAEDFEKANHLPECVWNYRNGKLELTVLGYLNGAILSTGSDKRLILDTETQRVAFDKYR
jgi:hypothetical protein